VNNQWFSKVAVWLVIGLVLFTVFKQFDRGSFSGSQIGYSEFLDEVQAKRINSGTLMTSGFVSRPPILIVDWWATCATTASNLMSSRARSPLS